MDTGLVPNLIFVTALVFCSEHDIAFQWVPNEYVMFLLLCGLGNVPLMFPEKCIFALAAFLLFVPAALLTARLWRGSFGGADVKIIAVLLLCLPVYSSVGIVAQAFMLCGLFSIIYLSARSIIRLSRARRTPETTNSAAGRVKSPFEGTSPDGIPFVPFIAAAAFVSLLL
ncbi:MAG: prepilin peptidase [Clostridia bacterium]|nr:prepilin peptidase [Clostridia bacterium]